MAKVQLNAALKSLRGAMDGYVYKHYKDKRGTVLGRVPDMSRVKPSSAQLAQRDRMRAAGEFHRQVLADPKLLRKYQKLAKRQGINLSAATMAAAMRLRQKAQSGRTLGDKG
jgi:hypothetical protein